MSHLPRALGAAAIFFIAAAFWTVGGGVPGVLYLLVYAAIVLPGVPIGLALFGARHPAGWIAGIACGYAVAIVTLCAAMQTGIAGPLGFAASLAIVAAACWRLLRRRAPAVTLPEWTPSATGALAAVLLLTVALAAPPLARIGYQDDAGARRYRAYFTADFVWHMAMTAELTRFSLPPRNPYLAPAPIHYYWGYFVVPAVVAGAGPAPLRSVERCLQLNALATGLLLVSAIFLAAFAAVQRAWPAAAGTALALAASSLEGLYGLERLYSRGRPLANVRDMNIDAVTAWYFQGHRIDGLPRCLWYVPQHSLSYVLGLVALTAAAAGGSGMGSAGVLLAGVALGASTLLNPFVGAVFSAVWGLAIVVHALRTPRDIVKRILLHAPAAIPVVAAIAWCVANRMVQGAGGVVELGARDASLNAPILTLFLSVGPALIAGAAGVALARERLPRLVPAIVLAAVALFLIYFVRLGVDHEWVPFRAGQLLLTALAVLAASWCAAGRSVAGRAAIAGAAMILAIAGAPTTVIDAYNARDVWNMDEAPGFRWTLALSPDQQAAFAWIRGNTPRTAVVQMEPISRERESWSLIPSFAERHMAAGLPISLLRIPDYRARSEQVKTLFACADPHEALTLAHALHIRYLYVDEHDRHAYPGAAKFDAAPSLFATVFRSGAVAVYEVR